MHLPPSVCDGVEEKNDFKDNEENSETRKEINIIRLYIRLLYAMMKPIAQFASSTIQRFNDGTFDRLRADPAFRKTGIDEKKKKNDGDEGRGLRKEAVATRFRVSYLPIRK